MKTLKQRTKHIANESAFPGTQHVRQRIFSFRLHCSVPLPDTAGPCFLHSLHHRLQLDDDLHGAELEAAAPATLGLLTVHSAPVISNTSKLY